MFEDKNIIEAVIEYWEELREERSYPSEEDLDPDMLPEAWDNCFIIYPREGRYAFTHLGHAVKEAYGSDRNIECRIFLQSPSADSLVYKYDMVLDEKKPIVESSEFLNLQEELIRFKQCLLPLGHDDEGEITSILGCIHYHSA